MISFCMLYENIYNADNPPSESIIRDNTALDEWMEQRQEQIRESYADLEASRHNREAQAQGDRDTIRMPSKTVGFNIT